MKQAQLLTLASGAVFHYRERAATVLEHTGAGVLVQLNNNIGDRKFGPNSDWRTSPLREYLNGVFAQMLTEGNMNELLDTATDLTALDGTIDYGRSIDKVTLLTIDQCRKYRYIRPLPEDGWEWTSTPDSTPGGWDEDARYVVCLSTGGSIDSSGCSDAYGARPALTLPSNLTVEVPGGGGLADYTDAELLTELLKRQGGQ